jgi:hypothetical protein
MTEALQSIIDPAGAGDGPLPAGLSLSEPLAVAGVEGVVGADAGLHVDDVAEFRGLSRVDAYDEALVLAFERDGAVDGGPS